MIHEPFGWACFAKLGPRGEPVPCSFREWADSMADRARIVAVTEVGAQEVSTVFVGTGDSVNLAFFETMIFHEGPLAERSLRWTTWEEAEAGHLATVCALHLLQRGGPRV